MLTSILLLLVPNALAQGQEVLRFKQKTRLVEFDNYRYDILSLDSTRVRVRNLYSSILARTGQEIIDVQFSPDGLCYAVLLKNGSQQEVRLFDFAASYSKNK